MSNPFIDVTTKVVNGLLGIQPLAEFLKQKARSMMIDRAATIGVMWQEEANALRWRNGAPLNDDQSHKSHSRSDRPVHRTLGTEDVAPQWQETIAAVQNLSLDYPDYYLKPFHAYQEGNLGWLPAVEVEVAAKAVHARIWPEAGAEGDARLRRSYHEALKPQLSEMPQCIVDLGCSVGMSTFALQDCYPDAEMTGVDLSPYFLAVAQYRDQERQGGDRSPVKWVHAAAEATPLPTGTFDLVSACLVFHELPQSAARAIFQEARRLLKPGGHFAMMDMNPQSDTFAKLSPYVLTLLKSTEPYLDEYFTLEVEEALRAAGFDAPAVTCNSPRHRTIVAKAL